MERDWFNLPFGVWAIICLSIAAVYAFIWPSDRVGDAGPPRFLIVRRGHSLAWVLLALMRSLEAFGNPSMANRGNLVGLACTAFVVATFFWV
jgi:hypothetical protein